MKWKCLELTIGSKRTCTLRQVARAARMRAQSAGWVNRNPTDEEEEEEEEEEEDTEHQNGDSD